MDFRFEQQLVLLSEMVLRAAQEALAPVSEDQVTQALAAYRKARKDGLRLPQARRYYRTLSEAFRDKSEALTFFRETFGFDEEGIRQLAATMRRRRR